jgi:DNA-binding transcriptional regulator LsrR (DeoR family)
MGRNRAKTTKRLIAKVAWLYHKAGLTQQQIADRLDINRVRVSKLLATALEEGVVKISVISPYVEAFELERELCSRFGLKEAIVVPRMDSPKALRQAIGLASAQYLEQILTDDDILGTAWGSTVSEVARQLRPERSLPNLTVIQLMGGLSHATSNINPLDITQIIAEKYKAKHMTLYAPAVVDSKKIRDILLSEQSIKKAIETAKQSTKALVGIGPANEQSTLVQSGFADQSSLQGVIEKGAVGDIVGRFYYTDGQPVASDLDDRTISLELACIKKIPFVIGVAGGPHKVNAICGALRGGYLDALFTDDNTASSILAMSEAEKQ